MDRPWKMLALPNSASSTEEGRTRITAIKRDNLMNIHKTDQETYRQSHQDDKPDIMQLQTTEMGCMTLAGPSQEAYHGQCKQDKLLQLLAHSTHKQSHIGTINRQKKGQNYHNATKYTPIGKHCNINSENIISCNWNEIFQANNSQTLFPCNSLNHKRARDMQFSGNWFHKNYFSCNWDDNSEIKIMYVIFSG